MHKVTLSNKVCTAGLSLLLFAGSIPVSAQSSVSIYQKLSEYENILFGKVSKSLPIEKRLQNLEKVLFGKSSSESSSERVAAIEKVMSGKGGSEYLPPVAPTMDRSEFAPEPKQAPESPNLNEARDALDAPQPAGSEDRVKGLLRQAMQSYSQGKTEEAERLYKQVLAADFRNVDANYNLGAIAENKGDLSAASRFYATALKGNPSDLELQDAYNAVQQKLKSQPITAAKPEARSPESDILPGAPMTASDKAIAAEAAEAYKKGNFDDAIAKLSYLARKSPFDPNTQFALGQAFRGKGKNSEAIKHLRSAATLNPKNDLYVKSLNDLQSQMDDAQQTASTGAGGGGSPSNDVLPFAGLPGSDSGAELSSAGNASEMAAIQDYLRRNTGSGMMIGFVTGFGNPMGGIGMSTMGGFPAMLGTAPGGTRLKRVVSSSLTGAAIGAMSNRGYPGGMSKGAMRGAMYGGLFGLMLGGY